MQERRTVWIVVENTRTKYSWIDINPWNHSNKIRATDSTMSLPLAPDLELALWSTFSALACRLYGKVIVARIL
jgi:hypothetical protein